MNSFVVFHAYGIFRKHLDVSLVSSVEEYRRILAILELIVHEISEVKGMIYGKTEVIDLRTKKKSFKPQILPINKFCGPNFRSRQ